MQNMIFGLFEEYIEKKDYFPSFKEILDEEENKFHQFNTGKYKFKGAVEKVIQQLPTSDQN